GQVDVLLDRETHSLDEVVRYCEERIQVLLAGHIAEYVLTGNYDEAGATDQNNWDRSMRVEQDRIKFSELLAILSNMSTEPANLNTRQSIHNRLWQQTTDYLVANSNALDAIQRAVVEGRGIQTTNQLIELDAVAEA